MSNKLTVGITQGDSNGIGYEVIIKALADERMLELCTPVIYGSSKIFGFYRKQLHNIGQVNTNVISNAKDAHPKRVNILNCIPENTCIEPGLSTPDAAKAATGHTEYLKTSFGTDDVTMIMVAEQLKVGIVTSHIPLKDVPGALTVEKILAKLRALKHSMERDFGIHSPKIAVLGLNPHCGDGGLLGDEEQSVILPAINAATDEGILAFGPYSADGFFGLGNYSRYDAILAMYHDQGLAPFKAIAFESGVNFTAGLPAVRTSPDHGTAYEKAGKDAADPRSMISAIYTAIDVYRNRQAYDELVENRMQVKMPDNTIKPKGGKIIE